MLEIQILKIRGWENRLEKLGEDLSLEVESSKARLERSQLYRVTEAPVVIRICEALMAFNLLELEKHLEPNFHFAFFPPQTFHDPRNNLKVMAHRFMNVPEFIVH